MKAGPQADRFGAFVVANFRDAAINFFDGLARASWKSPRVQGLQAALAALTPEQRAVVRRCVIEAVDDGLHDFLFALQEAHNRGDGIAVMVDGQNVADQSDGLPAELFSDEGWLARYSKHGQLADPA
jgi:hypothetical protein